MFKRGRLNRIRFKRPRFKRPRLNLLQLKSSMTNIKVTIENVNVI